MLTLSRAPRLRLDLQEAGLAIREEPYTMRVPRSQRGGEVIEPLVREQWFVSMRPLAEPALTVRPPLASSRSGSTCRRGHRAACAGAVVCVHAAAGGARPQGEGPPLASSHSW